MGSRGRGLAGICAASALSLLLLQLFALAQAPPAIPPPASPPAASPPPATAPGVARTATPPAADTATAVPPAELSAIPPVTLPEPSDIEVIDVPNDDGTALGVLWKWVGATPDTLQVAVQLAGDPAWLDRYKLTADEEQRVQNAVAKYNELLAPLTPKIEEAGKTLGEAEAALTLGLANKTPDVPQLRLARWRAVVAAADLDEQKGKLDNWLEAHTGKLLEKKMRHDYLAAALTTAGPDGTWLDTGVGGPAASLGGTKDAATNRFGLKPRGGDKLYQEITALIAPAPAGTEPGSTTAYGQPAPPRLKIPLEPGLTGKLRMAVSDDGASANYDLGSATAKVNYFNTSTWNNFVLALAFSIIVLLAISAARRNPNLFIRRIAGLEAVDEAIGRATEMGKPVLYLNGMNTLADLSTLAAVSILGRVARRVAAFDSALLVPCRDPVVMGVAQEVVREGFIEAGRPDAYRDDNIFFVTDDQFAYTAAVCATMVRERPAANFFMGYYYAESLLLAETGSRTGAIQIAGTDSQSQLPFFITTCDYTLIGEELYAASAYLSREPLLLGSLKGQDIGKAVIMLLIIAQTVLFLVNKDFSWLKDMVTPL